MDFANFKRGIENLLRHPLSEEEMVELCAEPLLQLLREAVQKESEAANETNHN